MEAQDLELEICYLVSKSVTDTLEKAHFKMVDWTLHGGAHF